MCPTLWMQKSPTQNPCDSLPLYSKFISFCFGWRWQVGSNGLFPHCTILWIFVWDCFPSSMTSKVIIILCHLVMLQFALLWLYQFTSNEENILSYIWASRCVTVQTGLWQVTISSLGHLAHSLTLANPLFSISSINSVTYATLSLFTEFALHDISSILLYILMFKFLFFLTIECQQYLSIQLYEVYWDICVQWGNLEIFCSRCINVSRINSNLIKDAAKF